MSISNIVNGAFGGLSKEQSAKRRNPGGMAQEVDEFAQSLVERRDSDGDGLLNLGETGLKEDAFGSLDANSDGLLSSDELSAYMKEQIDRTSSMMGQLNMLMQSLEGGNSSEQIATSIVKEKDADGDGLLSLDESGMSDKLFNTVDADGDGFVSVDELGAGIDQAAKTLAEMGGGPPPKPQGVDGTSTDDASTEAASEDSGSSGGGGDGGGDKDYDEYDLNKDGVVSYDEYLQAFENGDMSLAGMFGEGGGRGQTLTQRLAIKAYSAQAAL